MSLNLVPPFSPTSDVGASIVAVQLGLSNLRSLSKEKASGACRSLVEKISILKGRLLASCNTVSKSIDEKKKK